MIRIQRASVRVRFVPFIIIASCVFFLSFARAADVDQARENERFVLKTSLSYLMGQAQFDEAEKSVHKFLIKYPDDWEALQLSGYIYFAKRDYPKAKEAFRQAAKYSVNADKAINLYLLANSQIRDREFSEAEASLNEMREIPNSNFYVEMAVQELRNNRTIPEFNAKMLTENPPVEGRAGAPARAGLGWMWTVEGVYGLDSNPIFVPDNSESKNDAASNFYAFNGSLVRKTLLYKGEFTNALNVGYTGYDTKAAQAFNNLRLGFNSQWKPDFDFFQRHQISFKNKIDQSYGAEKSPEYFFTSELFTLQKDFSEIGRNKFSSFLNVGYRTYANKNLTSKEDDRSGVPMGLGLSHKLKGSSLMWLNSASYTNLNTVGGKFDTTEVSVVSNVQAQAPLDTEALFSLSYSRVDYPNYGSTRADQSVGAGIELSYEVPKVRGMNIKFSVTRTKNTSDLSSSNFTQDIMALSVTYDAF